MKTPTFREQYDKIVNAYLRDELEPLQSCACFIGNLLNNQPSWGTVVNAKDTHFAGFVCHQPSKESAYLRVIQQNSGGLYNRTDIANLENNFLDGVHRQTAPFCFSWREPSHPEYEAILFEAMESTLLMLKKIHESKGEIVEDYVFEKRQLAEITKP